MGRVKVLESLEVTDHTREAVNEHQNSARVTEVLAVSFTSPTEDAGKSSRNIGF